MKTKMNETNKKSINSKLISCSALALVLSIAVLVPCQDAVGTVPNTSPTANSGLIKSTETRENSGLRLSGEEMHGAKSATTDDCKDLMNQFKAKIKLIESLRCATDEKSINKRGKAVTEAFQLIQEMVAAGCAVNIAKLTHMVAHAAGCDEDVEEEDGISGNG
jgi:hypothetical protein